MKFESKYKVNLMHIKMSSVKMSAILFRPLRCGYNVPVKTANEDIYLAIKHTIRDNTAADGLERGLQRKGTHYSDGRMGAIASQINSLTIVYSTVRSGADQRKHQSSAQLAFVRGIHR